MTRPKVPDDKRQRIAQACDTCKRRKQKCNGQTPCNTCVKRHLSCDYTSTGSSDSSSTNTTGSPVKRRHIEVSPRIHTGADGLSGQPLSATVKPKDGSLVPSTGDELRGRRRPRQARRSGRNLALDTPPGQNASTELDEEAEVYGQTRMLQDPTGRLLYVGDSATLSYLQLIRMVVDGAAGPSQFTSDPNRHMILEATATIPPTIHIPPILPDREAAMILVNAFFTNTHGLIDVFDRQAFRESLDACYSNPLSIDGPFLCLLYLTLAIGLILATPIPNSPEDVIIKRLRSDPVDRAEIFFRGARCQGDPTSGFEDSDFWSVQALCLMSVYMLAASKRNAAYAYYGMAVRTAFALGLHRIGETAMLFDHNQVVLRRNLWRSLFVLDRFLATSLGRPTAISEEDCSSDALDSPKPMVHSRMHAADENLSSRGLDAAVKTCQSIGQILKKVYSKRRISTKLAQGIAGECELWTSRIHSDLDSSKLFNGTITAAQGMAILHVQLLACHSIILLTRPFFLYLLIKDQKESKETSRPLKRPTSKLDRFSEACVAASTQTIALVQTAYQSNYLPQRNPFVIYFLFAATLTILSNEFACLYKNKHYAESISNAINIVKYCATSEAQAQRLLFILTSFRSVVEEQARSSGMGQRTRSMHMDMSGGNIAEPLARLATAPQSILDVQINKDPGPQSGSPSMSLPGLTLALASPSKPSILEPRTATGMSDIVGVSPMSSRTASTQSRLTRLATEGDKADSIGGEQEFDFDCFWDFQEPLESVQESIPEPGATSSAMQQPGMAAGTYGYENFPSFSSAAETQGHTSTAPIGSGAPLFSAVNYQE